MKKIWPYMLASFLLVWGCLYVIAKFLFHVLAANGVKGLPQ